VRPRHLPVVVLAVLIVSAACGGSGGGGRAGGPVPAGVSPATAPAAAVEQFMGFAAQQKYSEMGYVFGTARGSVAERQPAASVHRRMQAIASVLRHDSYSMTGVVPVPGRPEARRVTVQLRQGQRTRTVPFTVVEGPGGRWLVEVVDLEAAMDVRRG
jgi:hypothetical protein